MRSLTIFINLRAACNNRSVPLNQKNPLFSYEFHKSSQKEKAEDKSSKKVHEKILTKTISAETHFLKLVITLTLMTKNDCESKH